MQLKSYRFRAACDMPLLATDFRDTAPPPMLRDLPMSGVPPVGIRPPNRRLCQGQSSKFGTNRCRPNADIRSYSSNIE